MLWEILLLEEIIIVGDIAVLWIENVLLDTEFKI